MTCYESMLLDRGGGISPESAGSKEEVSEAGLIIGLGGTGIAALHTVIENFSEEKQLPGMRFLTIDEDKGADISLLAQGEPRPATRARGRAMILAKAGEIREKISELCRSALADRNTDSVSVFVLAGLSGITGGSCCADLCYIVRDVLGQLKDVTSSVHGIFFLPDVAQSSPAVFGHRDIVERRFEQACGYAALTELDSLMRMTGEKRPVDFFYLISASNEYGSLSSNAYEACLGTAAGFIVEYFRMPEKIRKEYDQTRRKQQAPDRYVTMLGVSQRTLPLTQTATLLVSRFCLEFQMELRGRREDGPTYAQLHDDAVTIGLETDAIMEAVTDGYPEFELPETNMKELRACGAVSDGEFPSVWSEDIENWMDACARVRKENCRKLRKTFRDQIAEKISRDMYSQGRGPYYVKDFLSRRGSDIREVIHEIREDVRDRFRVQKESLYGRNGRGGLVTELERASADFVHGGIFGRSKKYERYAEAVRKLIHAENEILLLADVKKLLKKTDAFVEKYEKSHIEPLLEVIENLGETSSLNIKYLEDRRNTKGGFAKPFFRPEDLHPILEEIQAQTDHVEMKREFLTFLQRILQHPERQKSVQRRIGGWLSATFGSMAVEAADEYVIRMQEQIQRALGRMCQRITGQLWCDDLQAGETFRFLDVPQNPSSLYKLAGTIQSSGILYSCTENEMTAVCVRDGISVSSYRGLSQLQKEYAPYEKSDEMNLNLSANIL